MLGETGSFQEEVYGNDEFIRRIPQPNLITIQRKGLEEKVEGLNSLVDGDIIESTKGTRLMYQQLERDSPRLSFVTDLGSGQYMVEVVPKRESLSIINGKINFPSDDDIAIKHCSGTNGYKGIAHALKQGGYYS